MFDLEGIDGNVASHTYNAKLVVLQTSRDQFTLCNLISGWMEESRFTLPVLGKLPSTLLRRWRNGVENFEVKQGKRTGAAERKHSF